MSSAAVHAQVEEFRYVGTRTAAVSGIDLRIERGEFVIVTGPSGSGKTTLCYCLAGVIPKSVRGQFSGKVKLLGEDISELTLPEISSRLGLVMQSPENQLFNITVREDLAFGPQNYCLPLDEVSRRVDFAANFTGTTHLLDRFSHQLSGGESQRVVLASILALEPELYVFDQPAAELDPAGRRKIYENIYHLNKDVGKTVVLVEDRLADVISYADRILLVEEGGITYDLPPRRFFSMPDLEDHGIRLPDSVSLYRALKAEGVEMDLLPLNVEEVVDQLKRVKLADPPSDAQPSSGPTGDDPVAGPNGDADPAVEFEAVTYRYPIGVEAIKDIDLTIREGQFVAIVGQNGAGKSTLAKHIVGLLRPTRGTVRVQGEDIHEKPVHEISRRVGFLFQDPDYQTFNNSCLDEVAYGLKLRGLPKAEVRRRAMESLEKLDLAAFWDDHPYTLGRGQRQRLAVATVHALQPSLLVVDEPSTGLDYRETMGMFRLLEEYVQEGRTVVIITHDVDMAARFAEQVIVMAGGEIVLDLPASDMPMHLDRLQALSLALPDSSWIARDLNLSDRVRTSEELVGLVLNRLGAAER